MEGNFNVDLTEITKAGILKNASKRVSMSDTGIDILATDTMQLSMVVNDHLNKILDIMNNTKEHYQSEAADAMRRKFTELSENFPIMVQNIENYAYSLKKAKSNMNNRIEEAGIELDKATANIQNLIKEQ